jgi:hypothetical protein
MTDVPQIFCDTAQNLIAMNYAVIVIQSIIALGFIGKALKYSDVYYIYTKFNSANIKYAIILITALYVDQATKYLKWILSVCKLQNPGCVCVETCRQGGRRDKGGCHMVTRKIITQWLKDNHPIVHIWS